MAFEGKLIIGRVENVIFAGGLSISQWDIIFTNEELIFVKMVKRNWIIMFGSLLIVVGIFVDPRFLSFTLMILGCLLIVAGSMGIGIVKKKRLKMRNMGISEMLADDKDNFRLTREELKNIEVKKGGALIRSRFFLKKRGKKMSFGFKKKEDVDIFLSLLEKIKSGR